MKSNRRKLLTVLTALVLVICQVFVYTPETFIKAADTANLALGKTVTANNYIQNYAAANVNDGNVNTYWEGAANSYPNNLTADLGSSQSVNKIVLKLNSSWEERFQTLSVLTSNDNTNYTTAVAPAAYTFSPSASNTVTITFNQVSARYIRLQFTANTKATGGQAAEFEIYGTADSGSGGGSGTPDLVVTDISWNPASPAAGNSVVFSATVKNQGTGATQAGVINGVSFFVDGTQVSWSDNNTSSIAAGDSVTVTATGGPGSTASWSAVSGSHTVKAWVDDVNRISESNEDNNQYSKSITVTDSGQGGGTGGTPDLIVTDITSSPASPLTGNTTTFSAVVKNQGTGATPAGTIIGVSFFIDGIQVSWSDNTTTSLAAGDSVTVTATGGPAGTAAWIAATGSHTVKAYVDDVNRITETDENNNQYSENLTVTTAPMPDMVVTGLTITPSSPTAGDTLTFSAAVKNQGNAAGVPGVLAIGVDGTTVYTSTNNTTPLNTGAVTTVTGTIAGLSAGTHTITATIDNAGTTAESNETNNTYSTSLTVNPKPGIDFAITQVSYSPSYVTAGNAVTFNAVVKNQGTMAGSVGTVAFLVDGVQVAASANSTASIAAGSTLAVTAAMAWTATGGTHVITAVADSLNAVSETDETNNTLNANLTIGSGGRGATVPYTRYESEDAQLGGGAVLRTAPDFNYALIASEASNQAYAALPSNGSYVEWTINQGGAGVDMRFTIPDTSNGMGLNGSLDCFVNGTKVSTINLTSYYSWQYFTGDQPADAPNGGQAAFRFDEVHWKLPAALKAGDKLRIQKTNGDSVEYGVDFVEVEPVPSAIAQPANSLSVTSYGAVANDGADDLTAFNACVSAAASQGKTVYIPAGTFNLGGMWTITAQNITITGAGMWYTNLQFTSPNAASGGISFRITGTVDFSNVYINSMLRTRYNQNAIYKCFMDNFGTNSKVHDFWEEHFECGFWVGDYAHTPAIAADNLLIEKGRVRNNLADGVNFCQGTKNSTVRNCSVRNNGDDGLAMWPDSTMGAPMEVNNSFLYNTIENNWRAAGIAIFGGSGHRAQYNYIKDCFMGSGIRLNTVFPGYHFENNTGIVFSDTTIINSGTSKDCYNGERGAIDLEASNTSIKNITFENIDIINSQRDAIQFGYGGGFSNVVFKNININGTGKDAITTSRFSAPHLGEAIYTYTSNGSATFINLTTSNIEAPEKYLIMNGFNITFQ
ncbi:CARDB domain-containing protein [Anaerocolumna xylanovorans]|uniref:Serine protease, subtilase family n=1 Tax=Anaerocolumna xylanovorans DSM 12503 TaxID=1121345 RepID=A0A1M7XX32_9FIRM|nr:CARDB domain-containing protein [Anaerocolumna xylanovorans]SHO43404.1 Serine protease, subtilase family [Anaerocolumna xylanovorans DSM 12503]